MRRLISTLAVAALAAVVWPVQSFGLAALAGGAKTSCKITATNPIQRQIQINMDPFAVIDYAMAIEFPVQFLDVVSINGINGYQVDDTSIIEDAGLRVFGSAIDEPVIGEVDVYTIVFQLKDGLPLDTLLNFKVRALGERDFIRALNVENNEIVEYRGPFDPITNPTGVLESFDFGSVAQGSLIPEPTSVALLGLATMAGLRRRRA